MLNENAIQSAEYETLLGKNGQDAGQAVPHLFKTFLPHHPCFAHEKAILGAFLRSAM